MDAAANSTMSRNAPTTAGEQQPTTNSNSQPTAPLDGAATGISLQEIESYLADLVDESPALLSSDTFVQLFSLSETETLGHRVVQHPMNDDCFFAGAYYHPKFDDQQIRLHIPFTDHGSTYEHHTDFLKGDTLESKAHPRFMKFGENNREMVDHREYGYWRIEASRSSVGLTIFEALNAGHPVVADLSLLAESLDLDDETDTAPTASSNHPPHDESASSGDAQDSDDLDVSTSGSPPAGAGGGGISDIGGSYGCPVPGCDYHGEFEAVRSHIGGKVAQGSTAHRVVSFESD